MPRMSVDVPARTAQALFLLVIAALACTTSMVISVRFCWGLRGEDGIAAGLLAVALGLSWELAKLIYGPIGLRLALSGRPSSSAGGVGLCALAATLVAGSVLASLGYFVDLDGRAQQQALAASRQYQDLKGQLSTLDEQIQAMLQTATLDTQTSYRRRALQTLSGVELLRQKRQEVSDALLRWEASPPTHAQAGMLAGLAILFDIDLGRMRWLAYGGVASMLELISLSSITLLGWHTRRAPIAFARPGLSSGDPDPDDDTKAPPTPSPPGPRCRALWADPAQVQCAMPPTGASSGAATHLCAAREQSESPGAASANTASLAAHAEPADAASSADQEGKCESLSEPEKAECKARGGEVPGAEGASAEPDCPLDRKYDEAKHLVLSGTVAPRYRDLKDALHIGQQAVQRYLLAMLDEGCIIRCGRGYEPTVTGA